MEGRFTLLQCLWVAILKGLGIVSGKRGLSVGDRVLI